MSCPCVPYKYRLKETFTAPRVTISAETATEAQYTDATVAFTLENKLFNVSIEASTIHKTVVFAALNIIDQYGITTAVPEQWVMSLTAIVDYTDMTGIPAGEYVMEYSVVYPSGVKKHYGRANVILED
jgi:hypothetical protein